MATRTEPTTPAGELPLTPEEQNYLSHGDPPLMKEGEKILLKGTVTPEEKEFLTKRMFVDRKMMSAEYNSVEEVATEINGGKPSKR